MRMAYRLLQGTDTTLAHSARPLEDFAALLPALGVRVGGRDVT